MAAALLHLAMIQQPSSWDGYGVGVGVCGPGSAVNFDAEVLVMHRLRQTGAVLGVSTCQMDVWDLGAVKRSTMSSCSSQLYSNCADVLLTKTKFVMYLMSMKRVAIYARSSPDCPLMADEQISQLSKVAAEHGWTVANVFTDCPTSVKKDQDRRRGELALIGAIRSEAIDRVPSGPSTALGNVSSI